MTTATKETAATPRYRGVLCGHCRQPIPIPGIIERLAAADGETAPRERSVRAFHLRCRVCEREKTYYTGDITEFEGTPRKRSRAYGSYVGPIGPVARAAHG